MTEDKANQENANVMRYLNEEKTVITLPVPLGTELYQVETRCGDFCTFQEKHFDKCFPRVKGGRCGVGMPCHTVPWSVSKLTLDFSNIEWVLKDYGTRIFPTKKQAEKRMAEIITDNRVAMRVMGFNMRDDGHSMQEDANKLNVFYVNEPIQTPYCEQCGAKKDDEV